jgi:DNA topoisomerase I
MVQMGETQTDDENEENKPRFAGLRRGQSIETITLEEALKLFELPKTLGVHEGQEISVNLGRFGPYLKWGEQNISMPRGVDPHDVDMERAIELLDEKARADAPIAHYEDKPVTKGTGRFGPFIKWNEMYINVPRRYNFEALSQKDIDELIEAKVKKEENRYIQNWPEEKISIENARWGPVLRFGKKILKVGRKADESKYTAEELTTVPLDEVKKMIELQIPNAFATKKAAAKKAPGKKAAPKKDATKKAAPKKKSK